MLTHKALATISCHEIPAPYTLLRAIARYIRGDSILLLLNRHQFRRQLNPPTAFFHQPSQRLFHAPLR